MIRCSVLCNAVRWSAPASLNMLKKLLKRTSLKKVCEVLNYGGSQWLP